MRIGIFLVIALVAASFVSSTEILTGKFGALEITNESVDVIEKDIYLPDDTIYYDTLARAQYLRTTLEQSKVNAKKMLENKIYKCDNHSWSTDDDFSFAPVYVGTLMNSSSVVDYEGTCFTTMRFTMKNLDDGSVQVTIDASNKKSLMCREALFISTTSRHHVEYMFFSKKHVLTFKNMDTDDLIDLNLSGMRMYMFCNGVADSFVSVFHTLKLFLGGLGENPKWPIIGSHVPEYMELENVHFLKEAMGWELEKRDVTEVDLDESYIHDGDFLAITRLDGLDEIIMWGTGSHIGHSTVALTLDGELNIVESQDAWYWPKHKIQRNPYKQWVQYAKNCDFHVAVLPLKDELRAKFNREKATEWFETVEGMPYGYHNFLFSWIDTVEDNYPPALPKEFIGIGFEIFGEIMPSVIETFFLQAMNFRLDTKGLNFKQVVTEAAKRNTTLLELMAQPELDGWYYNDGYSYVCSCFVIGLYKAGGLFDGMDINAVEFTPKDVYQLNFFNTTAELPQKCKEADPSLPYCQILGKYRMTLPGYSTIEPYEHMNEHCKSLGPDYVRPEGC